MSQTPPQIIFDLIDRFERNIESYRSPAYNEAQVRQEFINPFFEALGWDVANKEGSAEAYKDVIHEDAIKVGAPDYCFRIGGARKFFLEAKKPAVNIKEDPDPAYQLRRYAWSAKLSLSILTDFEEFAVYDCRARPSPSDKASAGRIHYLTYKEYATRWDEIASVFSKDAVRKGSFDKYAVSERKRGTTTVDAAFLAEIEKWRDALARNLAARNQALDVHELNFAVQRTIDRLIFLRICEDRGIEPYAQLQALLNGENIYGRLRHLYDQADDRYNSGLFHFRSEKDRAETPDELTPKLKIDDKVLKDIIHGLYYPESPYEFSVMPAEILGQVYEQFLGKVIRLTSGHQAKVEEKPEVKKAGGVYYTPAYIVAYIVRNTVGKLCEGKTPKQISKLKILDPACGSGSFLIGAYDYLVAYHRDWYLKDGAEKHTKELYQGAGGLWHLTTQEKKRILLNNIYGVDIDSQAVEVTKLSLLLKVLEGENQETLKKQLKMWHERALPDLGRNIKCGNSLIGPDYFSGQLLPDDEARHSINPFDWQREFSEIMKAGGFDVVIGNPPYVNAWELFENMPSVRDFINHSGVFQTADRHWDLYVLFLERGLQLLREGGRLSFIIPYSYAIQKYGMASRTMVLEQYQVESIADLRSVRVFGKVPVITIIPVIEKRKPSPQHAIEIRKPGAEATKYYPNSIVLSHKVSQKLLQSQHEHMLRIDLADEAQGICKKIEANSITVGDICWVNYGAQMSSKEKGKFGKEFVMRDSPETKTCKRTVSGRNLYRYSVRWDGKYVEWKLAGQMYGPREPAFFETPKLMIRDITGTHRLELTLDGSGLYCDHTILCALRACDAAQWKDLGAASKDLSSQYSFALLLGLLASSPVSAYYYWKLTGEGVRTGGGFHTYPKTIRQLPIFDRRKASGDKLKALSRIENLVERMLDLHERLATAKAPDDKTKLQRQIDATDQEIDRLVHDLYGLTEEEIGIVEGRA